MEFIHFAHGASSVFGILGSERDNGDVVLQPGWHESGPRGGKAMFIERETTGFGV